MLLVELCDWVSSSHVPDCSGGYYFSIEHVERNYITLIQFMYIQTSLEPFGLMISSAVYIFVSIATRYSCLKPMIQLLTAIEHLG